MTALPGRASDPVGLLTCGAWWIVWLFLAISGGEFRRMVTVDEFGNVLVQKV